MKFFIFIFFFFVFFLHLAFQHEITGKQNKHESLEK